MLSKSYTIIKQIATTSTAALVKIFLTVFGSGYIKIAPGTWGTLVTLGFCWLFTGIIREISATEFVVFCTIIFFLGSFASDWYMKKHDIDDPGEIVIDEALGMFICFYLCQNLLINFAAVNSASSFNLSFEQTLNLIQYRAFDTNPDSFLWAYLMPFALFRFLDISKLWPISIFDRMKSGYGVMLDDIAAGVFAVVYYVFFAVTAALLGL